MLSNSVSISMSDDDSNETNRIRPSRTRRKRKKPGHRTTFGELPRYFLRLLLRYWILLVLLLALGLLLFESTRIGTKSANSDHSQLKKHNPDSSGNKKNEGNLNRLDPTTKVIGGVRQRKLSPSPSFNIN